MLHTDEHIIVPFTLKSLLGFVFLLVVLTAPLWWLKGKAVTAAPQFNLSGEWVGDATVTALILGIGSSQPLNKPGVLYLRLATYDSFLNKVEGRGQLLIVGDKQPRAVRILTLGPPKLDGRLSGEISGDLYVNGTNPHFAVHDASRVMQGHATDGVLTLHTINDGNTVGYVFESSLHHGSQQEFKNRCTQVNAGLSDAKIY